MPYIINQESPDQEEIFPLIQALDEALDAEYKGFCNHRLDVTALLSPQIRFFVARDEAQKAVGIGAVRFNDGYAEVKRMYSLPALRGLGIGEAILIKVLDTIRAEGETIVRLETGEKLTAALGLYQKYGFKPIPAFGEYGATEKTSYCMEAALARA